jgi:hypothetical protein
VLHQYPAVPHHDQMLYPSHSMAQPPPQTSPTAAQPASVPSGSQAPGPSTEDHSAWHQIRSESTRWDPNRPEPVRGDGHSILMNFAARGDRAIYCCVPMSHEFCGYSSEKKERLLHHIRKEHLNFLPFPCGGECGSQTWCVLRYPLQPLSVTITI